MSRPTTRKDILVMAKAACVLVVLGLSFMVYQSYASLQKARSVLVKEQARMGYNSGLIQQTQAMISQYKQEQEKFQDIIFKERDVPAFIERISQSAALANVYVSRIQSEKFTEVKLPETASPGGVAASAKVLSLTAMPVRISVRGTFDAIVSFLSSIEGYRQLLTVSNVVIKSDANYPRLNCDFTLKIYSVKTTDGKI